MVEPVGDGLVAQAFFDPQREYLRDDGSVEWIGRELVFRGSFGTASRNRVRDAERLVAVGRFSDVEALGGVGLESTPGFLQQFQDVPLSDALLHAPGEDLRGAFPVEVDRFVGGQEGHACLFEAVLNERADVGSAGYPLDRFADDNVEPAVGALRLFQ
ncbi:hypothetical protein [Actinomadura soli]|uniref:hypothetical protein n=1 Tax=Actinomadura soli TaxID=2508997 RepID=UPI001E5A95EC|nr:hypothetical protein [Actinomadura soli]